MATLASAYGLSRTDALTLLNHAGITGGDGDTSLSALEVKLAYDIAPRAFGADAIRAHSVLAAAA